MWTWRASRRRPFLLRDSPALRVQLWLQRTLHNPRLGPRPRPVAKRTPLALWLKGRKFQLQATVRCLGENAKSGRYVTFVPLDKGEQWLSYNDNNVQVCEPPPLNNTHSRLLSYEAAQRAGMLPALWRGAEDRLPTGALSARQEAGATRRRRPSRASPAAASARRNACC